MTKITVERNLLEQWLEALEQSETTVPYKGFGMDHRNAEVKHQAAITSLKAVLVGPTVDLVAEGRPATLAEIVSKARRDLEAVGGFDNGLVGVPASGVRLLIERLEAALAEPQEPVAYIDALKDAFFEGFTSVATYNDTLLNSPEEAWRKYKPPRIAPPKHKENT